MTTKSGKHANKIAKNALDSAANNGVTKAVDMRKVAALSAGAAGVIAGAAIAFGATPAMAADATSTPVDTSTSANTQDLTAKNDDSKKKAGETNQNKQTEVKKQDNQTVVNADNTEGKTDKQAADSTPAPSSTPAGALAGPNYGQVREADPAPAPKVNSTIELSQDKKDTLPNMYAWGSSDNVYIEKGQNQEVTFKFAKPSDGSTITKVAIFPSDGNTVDNTKSRKFLEYYSDAAAVNEHQPYSGTYEFKVDNDGTATLTMTKLYRDGNLKSGESYSANRCIYVYGTDKDGKTVVLYKTNIVRAATLIPPKTAGSIVLKYNEELTAQQIQDKLKAALDAPTEATGKKSIRDQITAASTSRGVGGRTGENGAFVQTPDTAENKVIITDQNAYDASQLAKINKVTSQQGQPTTYVAGAQTLKTYLISDLGYKSDVLPLTVARYDTRIDKPIVDEVDINKLTDDQKADICKKLANLNHVTQDKVTFNDKGEAVINFDGVDAADAPKIPLRELVLKKIAEDKISVPAADKAVFVANPLGYSKAEIERIKTAIFEANKGNKELGLTSTDQISLSYLTGDLTASGDANKGISNGQAENKITVKIKTDKAVAEFTSDIKANKLTKLPNIRTDYDVTWTKTKIDGRETDEGISWSNDSHTTIIYRYDPTAAKEFDTTKILGLLKATPKDKQAGLRDLTGGEQLTYEGTGNNAKKSHMHYALQNGEPTGELTLGNMGGAYWSGNQKVSNSDVDLGDNLSDAGSYSWDTEAGSVTVAAKKGKIFKARLFVEPYAMTYYKHVYLEQGRNPGNTAKAINVIFVPQTNHKTSDLQKSIGEHKTENVEGKDVPTQSKYYNASADKKDAYEKALKTATDLLATVKDKQEKDLTEEQKAQIDNATINLNKARAELDGADTNKDKLNDSIDANGKAAEGTTAATGTQATNQFKNVSDPDFKKADGSDDKDRNEAAKKAKTDYDKALEEANKVKEDKNATQKAVDDAKAKLDAAREKLNDFTTSKDELNNAIAQHGKVNTGDASKRGDEKLKTADPTYQNSNETERKAYDDAVAEADRVSKEPNASQKEVNDAIKKLKEAKDALDKNATDKSPLDAAVQKTLDNDSNKHSVFYTNAAAKKDTDAAAKKAVEDYDKALAEAKRVLGDKNATKADVDKAKKDLEDAEKVLYAETYQTKTTDLAEAIADNFSGYLMPAYFNAFDEAQAKGKDSQAAKDFKAYNDAYHAAKDLMEQLKKPDSTIKQTEVDKVKEQLIAARKIIDTYATDTKRLSAAVFNDIAIKASPAYQNMKALAEKTNPTPEEQADVEAAKKAKEAYDKAAEKLHNAITNQLPKDQADGHDIPDSNTPKKGGDLNSKDYLKDIQAHKNGEPLNRDVDSILQEMNDAAKALDKFATKTDELIKSINEDATTHPSPAFKNASLPSYKNDDGSDNTDKNNAAKKAVDEYGKALNTAKDLLNNPNATQKDINDAKTALDNARKALDAYKTNVDKLQASVDKNGKDAEGANPAVEGTKDSDAYRNASDPHFMKDQDGKLVPDTDKNNQAAADKKAYDEALTKAQELLKKHDDKDTPQDAKPTQKEIDEALKTLDEARKKLEDNYKTVTTGLETEINKSTAEHAPAVTEGDFEATPEFKNAQAKTSDGNENADVTAYKNALANARKLVSDAKDTNKKNSERPTQQQINDAFDALTAAKKQITDNYKTNFEALTSAKDFADDGFKKTPEYKNAVAKKTAGDQGATNDLGKDGEQTGFDNVLKKVTEKLNDEDWKKKATQKDVSALLKQLKDAQDKIAKTYKTDAIKLEREVGDKDQDGKPVTPPFEASVPYKNALAKSNDGDNDATAKLNAYNEKLKAAQDLINKVKNPDPNAAPADRPTQKQVDDALAALKKAKKDIDDNFKTKVDKLQNEVDDKNEDGTARTPKFEESTEFANLKGKTKDGKKPDDLVAYEQALAKAKDLIDKNDGKVTKDGQEVDVPKDQLPTQQEVDAAKKALKEIKDKILANYKTNPHDLQEEVDLSKDGDDDQRDTTFENTPEFKNADAKGDEASKKDLDDYNKKLQAAKALLDKFDRTTGKPKTLPAGEKAPTQKQLDDALDALKAAKKKITDDYKTDPSKLKSEADKDGDFTKTPEYVNAQAKGDDASKKDLEAYKKALEDANKVLGDKNATQKQVDDALKKLQDAKSKLTDGYKTDKDKLYQEKGNDPEFRKSIPFLIADNKDIAEYNKALNDANAVLADPNATQAQVDEALRKLQAIKQRILDFYNSLGSGSGDDSDGGSAGANNANANAVDKSMLHAEVNGALADVANGTANGAKGTKGALVDASVIKEFNDALENARRVLADPNATQEQVEAATMRLRAARAALNAAKANKGSNLRGNMGVQTGVDSA
ncbi:M protein repeat protein, partial [Gardnerella pickettii JCP7659]|uniref:FIVAR domain-containing protein n=1 Tax=Gardnerella pickettii TaxID=2914924 RepID=UPI00035398CA